MSFVLFSLHCLEGLNYLHAEAIGHHVSVSLMPGVEATNTFANKASAAAAVQPVAVRRTSIAFQHI